ncbi:MAG: DUF4912 domain-containing protein [Chthoniobacterales bacterium]|nr:DUF4912 domain-containing protein [Chthoniobacterales bacterium]
MKKSSSKTSSKTASKTPRRTKTAAAKKTARRKTKASKAPEDVHKFEAARPAGRRKAPARVLRPKSDIDNLGELPRSYGDDSIFVVAQEPHRLFCYWDYTLTDGLDGQVFLRHRREDSDEAEGEVAVPGESNSWYLAVREADAGYVVELGVYDHGKWRVLTRSGAVLTPRDSLAGPGDPVFANMPFHATFQQLVEKLRGEMREGESLAEALARLQKRGDVSVSNLTAAQRISLDTLLSTELGSLTSGDLGRFLSSPGASLFSGGFAPTSWPAPSSWTEAAGGVSSGFLALFGLIGASWSSAGAWSSALSSWSFSAMSSWSGASWGAESSWLSSWRTAPRGFFMHVNAEVIFYGGTHPDAKVTIDGKPVALRPDGSFRYHFVFPDGKYEIPVEATSPDGVETRRAVLRFERTTGREGDVGSTAQPSLGAPVGRQA